MITHFIIKEKIGNAMVRAGKYGERFLTYNLSAAKHFSSEWSAQNFLNKMQDPEIYKIVKIVHQ